MKSSAHKTVDVYDYFDYREYLSAVYNCKKRNDKGFSHRMFSREAGISSPNYLFRVIKGERALNGGYILKFCEALHLTRSERHYFTTLVQFNSESEITEKEKLLRTLQSLRYRRGIHRMDDKKLQFFSKWYYPVIRELAAVLDFKTDYNLLARSCIPHITAQQATSAIKYLLKNGFLQKDADDNFIRTNPVISTGDEVKSTILRGYHRQTLLQSIDALDSIAQEDRDISSLTLSVSRKTFVAIKAEIQDFRKRLLAMAKEDTNPEMVCLTGFQLLPRSKINKSEITRKLQ